MGFCVSGRQGRHNLFAAPPFLLVAQALHNHWLFESPRLMFVHFESVDKPLRFAAKVARAFEVLHHEVLAKTQRPTASIARRAATAGALGFRPPITWGAF